MSEYEKKENDMTFEERFCAQNVDVWKFEAIKLFQSADVLNKFSMLHMQWCFNQDSKILTDFPIEFLSTTSVNPRIIRMLWAYGLENALKGLCITEFGIQNADEMTMKSAGIYTHELIALFAKAKIPMNENEVFYVNAWQKCAEWMGRYPLPVRAKQLSQRRIGADSSETLFARRKIRMDLWKSGKINRMHTESDVLHGGISCEELKVFEALSKAVLGKYDR